LEKPERNLLEFGHFLIFRFYMTSLDQYTFTTANVVIGDASVPGYSIKPKRAGILELSKVGGLATVEIDGDIEAHGLRILRSGAERVLISGVDRDIASSFYPGSYVGDAGGMVTGVVDPARIAGDYDMGNLVVTGQLTASDIHANIDAGYLVSGRIDDARLDGSYQCRSLTVGPVTANMASGNLHTSRLVEGTLGPGRLQGQAYAFDTLSLDGNGTAHTVSAQVDAAHIVAGVLSPDRIGDGTYSVTDTTTTTLDVPTLILSGQPTRHAVVSVDTHVVASNTTVDELEYVRNLDEPVQVQLDRIREGLFDGNTLSHLDASQLTLGTVPDARLQGSYTFDTMSLANAGHASTVSANLDAADLSTGTIDPAFIAGSYTHMTNLTVTGTLETATISANADAADLVSGVIDDQRLGGSYAFQSLTVANTVDAAWATGNIDTTNLVSGVIPVERLDLTSIETNLVSSGPTTLGGQTTPWTFLDANIHHVDDLDVRTALRQGTASMQLDLAATSTNIVPLSTTYTIGTSAVPWSNVHVTDLDIRDTLTLGGQMYRADGTPFSFDLENVPIDILPEEGRSLWFGTEGARWGPAVASHLDTQSLASPWVTSSLVPNGPEPLDLGSPTHHWRDIHAANITGSVDGVRVGDIWAQVEYLDRDTGTIVGVDGVALPSERTPLRFFSDESTGLGLVDGTVPGKLDLTVDGGVVVVVEPGSVVSAANIVPMTTGTASLGRADAAWSRLFTTRLITPVGTLGPVGSSNIISASVDVASNLEVANVACSGTVSATRAEGTLAASHLTGTVQDGHFDGAYSIQTVDVANTLTLTNSVTCGHLIPSGNAVIDLGAPDARFRDMYVSNTSIHLGRVNVSEADSYVTLSSNLIVTNGISGAGIRPPLSISAIQITDDAWQPIDDTAISSSGGYLIVYGAGFGPGSLVKLADTNAVATGYVDATELRVQVGARTPGTYDLHVIRADTKTTTLPSAVHISESVTWITSGTLGTVSYQEHFAIPLEAVSDSQVVYANVDALPPGTTLNETTGLLEGNITTVDTSTLFSFDIRATDAELQDSVRGFLLQLVVVLLYSTQYTDASWSPLIQTAHDSNSANVFWTIDGVGLDEVTSILVDGTPATSFTAVGTSVLRVQGPPKARGTFDVTLVTPVTTKVFANSVVYSDVPTWITSGNLGTVSEDQSFSIQLEATSDSQVTYANVDTLPPQTSLNQTTGLLEGNVSNVLDDTLYSVDIAAVDEEFQDSTKTFLVQYLAALRVSKLATGQNHTIILSSRGRLAGVGFNNSGQTGTGDTVTPVTLPTDITTKGSLSGRVITDIGCMVNASAALTSDGVVNCWGQNNNAQCGQGHVTTPQLLPVTVAGGALAGKYVVAISCGENHTIALDSGGVVYAWGFNNAGQCAQGNFTTPQTLPVAISGGSLSGKVTVKIASGGNNAFALCSDNTVHAWGWASVGQLGSGNTFNQNLPIEITNTASLSGRTVVDIQGGASHTVFLCSDHSVHTVGANELGQCAVGNFESPQLTITNISNNGSLSGREVASIHCTGRTTHVRCTDGSIHAWGEGTFGTIGDGQNVNNRNLPVDITASGALAGKTVIGFANGEGTAYHQLAIVDGGKGVISWGKGGQSQLCDGGTGWRNTPVDVTQNIFAALDP